MRILGVDPGSRLTGFGCIDVIGRQIRHVTHGTLHLSKTSGKVVISLEDRLLSLYEGLTKVILEYKPTVMAVESVFFAKNAVSALKLGQARGAILLTGKIHSLEIAEYSPTQVKQSVAGFGQADKEQVAKMIQLLIGPQKFTTSDASDGLALAICHAQRLQSLPTQRNKKRLSLAEAVGASLTSATKPSLTKS